MRLAYSLLAVSAAAALAAPAIAHEVIYEAPLLGASEFPVAASPGTGTARVTVDLDTLMMRVEASFSGLLGNVTASHIHCCVLPGANAGVATQTPTFSGFPLGVTAGSYNQLFDMSLSASYNAAFITASGGTVGSAFNALILGLDAGKAYLNIHTTSFPGGEIRGLLAPVPEPTTYALLLGGLAVVGWAARRRHQA